jgi:hypothetical protein
MTFPQSVLLLLTVSTAICFPIFLGHAIAAHSLFWAAISFVFLGISAALFYVNVKLVRPPEHTTHHAHHGH